MRARQRHAAQQLDRASIRRAGKGRLVALDAATGRALWERRLPSPDFGCATVANDVVFTSTYDGTVYGFAAETGRLLWQARLRGRDATRARRSSATWCSSARASARAGATTQLVAYGLQRCQMTLNGLDVRRIFPFGPRNVTR